MLLTSLHVQHFRSLENVIVENLQPVTLLVGANAAGKSNIIDALRFLRDTFKDGLEHAISSRAGIEVIRQYAPSRPFNIGIQFNFIQTFHDNETRRGFYEIKIESLTKGNYRVTKEEAEWFIPSLEVVLKDSEEELREVNPTRCRLIRDASGQAKITKENEPGKDESYPVR